MSFNAKNDNNRILNWKKLDNVALIFPSSSSKADTHVFRFSCELNEPVDCELLQKALDDTIDEFPVFNYVLKRGMFWYYLEKTDLRPIVVEENRPPCSELYDINQKKLMYEVSYFGNSINFEIYHVLTDGTGAMHFLRLLVSRYITYKRGYCELPLDFDASYNQMEDDAFRRHYSGAHPKNKKKLPKAYVLRGQKFPESRIGIIRGHMSVKAVLDEARKRGVTMTVLLTAIMICAIAEDIPRRSMHRPVVINLPVNLRNYFKSESVRNFFCLVKIGYDFSKRSGEFDDVLAEVKAAFEREITPESLEDYMNGWASIESNPFVRISPLWFKDIVLNIAYRLSSNKYTAMLSNIGILRMPGECSSHIRSFDVCNGTQKIQACVCSYDDNLSISFTSAFTSCDIQRAFFRQLTAMGIEVEISTNLLNGGI